MSREQCCFTFSKQLICEGRHRTEFDLFLILIYNIYEIIMILLSQ